MARLFTIENIRKNLIKDFLTESVEDLSKKYPLIPYDELINWIKIDPTYKNNLESGLYSDWILTTFVYPKYKNRKAKEQWEQVKGKVNPKTNQPYNPPTLLPEVKTEDIQKLHNDLQLYNKYKFKINRPITDFKTEQDLYKTVQEASKQDKQTSMDNVYTIFKNAIQDGLKVIYGSLDDNSKWVIGIPETYEASHWFKKPVTNWCTAYPDNYKNYMDEGDLYIHLNKKTGELYQLHLETQSFMNKNDEPVNAKEFIKKYPELKEFYNTYLDVTDYEEFWSLSNNINEKKVILKLHYRPSKIQYLENPSEALQMASVQSDIDTIKYIDNPTENVCKYAILQDIYMPINSYIYPLQYIKSQSVELQNFAIKCNPENLAFIVNPTKKQILKSASLFSGKPIKEITKDLVNNLIQNKNPKAIILLNHSSEDMQEYVLKKGLENIWFINNPSVEIINDATKDILITAYDNNHKKFINYITNKLSKNKLNGLNDRLKYNVLIYNRNNIQYINDFSDELLQLLIGNRFDLVQLIKDKNINPNTQSIQTDIRYHPMNLKYYYENNYDINQTMIKEIFSGWCNSEQRKELLKYILNNDIKMTTDTFEYIIKYHPELLSVIGEFDNNELDVMGSLYTLPELKKYQINVDILPESFLKQMIKKDYNNFRALDKPSIELQKYAIKINPELYHWIDYPSPEIKKYVKEILDKRES